MPFGARCCVAEKARGVLTGVMLMNGGGTKSQQKQTQTNQSAETHSAMMDETLEEHYLNYTSGRGVYRAWVYKLFTLGNQKNRCFVLKERDEQAGAVQN